jgi:putative Mn2+ efflux pump MntP
MDFITIMVVALGLAMDSFAVSITNGMTIRDEKVNNAFKIAAFFGAFQAFMPLIGWTAGIGFIDVISGVDHWIGFGLLCLIGCKMIYESTKAATEARVNSLNFYVLFVLSIATSIDAFAVGLSFAFLKTSIAVPIIVIGALTFMLSFLGVFVGNRFGHFLGKKIETVGGLILISIGVKILLEHLI